MTQESEMDELELALKRLEVEKMRADVDQARLAWWKRPGYLGGMAPIVLAVVGLVTAWANGYFDTQRTQLANEIAALEGERDALNAKVADAQRAIDAGYLQAKLAAFDADYAIGHFEAFSEQADEMKGPLSLQLVDLPEVPSSLGLPAFARAAETTLLKELKKQRDVLQEKNVFFQNLQALLEQQQMVGEVTKEAVTNVLDQLEQIEATPWVKALETDPMLSAQRRFRAPDGRIFDLASWDWVEG
ncbi:hypothetical protein C8N43_3228 [Litoreibacter ponti]|uniref:Uncharacterized protein n=1 Tax=Litoreibacter ponti TaxID=1510457 RepID=A0A2T6BEF1_9RHOB|nr:hypothetical protein [Litoreibacter ponti]PTX54414.1 hypothetical protein C8N43_3228 [Litoreibacter ponti]